ncbi:MAG TPA: DUF5335 family protein [Clostridia bacterium]|nr:DUF5335 family protein [Clostridia bacterium]
MKTIELNRKGWETFCDRVNHAGRETMVTVQHIESNGVTETVVKDMLLRELVLDQTSDPCNDNLVIKAGLEKPVQHVVIEPIHLRLKNGHNDRFHHLHVLAESGTTIVEFRPGLTPALLDGLDRS